MKSLFIFFCLLSLTFTFAHETDLVLKNGKIITMNDSYAGSGNSCL